MADPSRNIIIAAGVTLAVLLLVVWAISSSSSSTRQRATATGCVQPKRASVEAASSASIVASPIVQNPGAGATTAAIRRANALRETIAVNASAVEPEMAMVRRRSMAAVRTDDSVAAASSVFEANVLNQAHADLLHLDNSAIAALNIENEAAPGNSFKTIVTELIARDRALGPSGGATDSIGHVADGAEHVDSDGLGGVPVDAVHTPDGALALFAEALARDAPCAQGHPTAECGSDEHFGGAVFHGSRAAMQGGSQGGPLLPWVSSAGDWPTSCRQNPHQPHCATAQ